MTGFEQQLLTILNRLGQHQQHLAEAQQQTAEALTVIKEIMLTQVKDPAILKAIDNSSRERRGMPKTK